MFAQKYTLISVIVFFFFSGLCRLCIVTIGYVGVAVVVGGVVYMAKVLGFERILQLAIFIELI